MEGLYENWDIYSSPSGHTTLNITLYLSIFLLLTRHCHIKHKILSALATFVLLFLICFSRIYLNARWLTDIVGGVFLGTGSGCLLSYIFCATFLAPETTKDF